MFYEGLYLEMDKVIVCERTTLLRTNEIFRERWVRLEQNEYGQTTWIVEGNEIG